MDLFLSPGWWAGLAALVVPLAVHWLSRGRARVVRVASTRLLRAAETRSLRRPRLSDLLLLAARCMLVTAVVLALAEPATRPPASGKSALPRLLVEPAVVADRSRLEAANPDAYRRLEELQAAGAAGWWLTDRLVALGDPPPPAPPEEPDAWSLLREAARAGQPVEVFARDRLALLRGERPRLAVDVTWHALGDPGAEEWLESAWLRREGAVEAWLATTSAAATRLERRRFDPERPPEGFVVEDRDGATRVRWGREAVSAKSPRPLSVWLAHDAERAADATTLRAGLAAVAELHGRRLDLETADLDGEAVPEPRAGEAGLLFWLSARPPSETVQERAAAGGVLVSDGGARSAACPARLLLPAPFGEPRVSWWRCAEVDEGGRGPELELWSGPDGPLLGVVRTGDGLWFRLRGRFHPEFSDLTLHRGFARWLEELVERVAGTPGPTLPSRDRRAAGAAQAAPERAPRDAPSGDEPRRRSWEWPAWALVAGLLAVERGLAGRRR